MDDDRPILGGETGVVVFVVDPAGFVWSLGRCPDGSAVDQGVNDVGIAM